VSLNEKLDEVGEYVGSDIALEMKVVKLTEIVDILLEHAPERVKERVNKLLGE
jgi:hypothetical protein